MWKDRFIGIYEVLFNLEDTTKPVALKGNFRVSYTYNNVFKRRLKLELKVLGKK